MVDIFGALQSGWNMGQQMGEQKRQRTLADLLGKAATSSGPQRQQYVAQAYGEDPGVAMQAERAFGQQEDERAERLRERARMLVSLPPQMRPQAYASIVPELQQMGLGEGIPPQWSDDLLPTVEAIATSGQSQNSVQSRFVAEDGRVLMVMRDGSIVDSGEKADRQMWLRDHPGMAPELVGKDGMTRPVVDAPMGGLIPAVIQQESGGNPNAVSPAGARGLMQVMPQTGQDPGFGVAPLRDGSPQENVRFGTDYLTAMMDRYGDQSLALAAYNAGPGRVDQALQRAGGDPQRAIAMLPQETQQYVPQVLSRARPSEAEVAAEQEAAKRTVGLEFAPAEAAAAAERERQLKIAQAAGEAQGSAQYGSSEGREAARDAAKKLPQLQEVVRITDRIEQAVADLDGAFINTGPVDQYIQKFTEEGQTLVSDTGAIQNSMLALTRVPGVGSQSDLEQRISQLKYPQLGLAPSVNKRRVEDLRAFVRDLTAAYQNVLSGGGQQAKPSGDIDSLLGKYGIR